MEAADAAAGFAETGDIPSCARSGSARINVGLGLGRLPVSEPERELGRVWPMAMREAQEVFRIARELISDCECSVASLAAQLARRIDPDYAPREDPARTHRAPGDGGAPPLQFTA